MEHSGNASQTLRPSRNATVLAWVLPHLMAHVASVGHDTAPLRDLPGLRGRDLDDPDERVSDAAAADAWRMAAQLTADQALGLHMACAIPQGALDLLEYAFRSSATLEAALRQVARYGRIVSDRAMASLALDDDGMTLSWDGRAQRPRAEFVLALVVRLAREGTATPIVPAAVRFAFAAPADLVEYREFFRAPLEYDAPANQLRFGRHDLARPLTGADPALSGVLRRRLEKMLGQMPKPDDSATSQVRRELVDGLTRREPTAAVVAKALGVSERTLYRRLREEETSFRQILDQVRSELAAAMLGNRAIGIAEIAFVLGYSEPAAFHRSFRRWTGQTPLTFRRAAAAAVPAPPT